MPPQHFRIFISSPSDVFAERERVERVIVRLNGEFGGNLLEAIRWERSYYTAAKTFQDQIPLPSQADLVLCILWKRLGFELPPDYRRPDGTTPTGTEYEFEDAMQAARARGTPDVLVYRKAAPVLLDAEQIEREQAQFEALKTFWSRWFRSETGHFTAAYQSFETADQLEIQVEDHIRQWLPRRKMSAPGTTWSIELRGSPFRGLLPFDAEHEAVFFGRRRAVEQARERMTDAAGRGTPFLLILGTSGSGKSSIARAGLMPRLVLPGAVAGVDVWRHCVMRPSEGDTPLRALARAMYAPGVLPELAAGDNPASTDFVMLLRNAPDAAVRAVRLALARAFAGVAEREGFQRPVEARLLLLVDQFEEGLKTPEAGEDFARALAALVGGGCVWLVATLRSDLYTLFQRIPALVELRDCGAQLDLLPPGAAEITEIVTGPAAAAGLRFDMRADGTRLDDELITAAAAPGALPLLQLTLDALFDARDHATNTLTCAAFDALGGLPGVVERRAEATLTGLDPAASGTLPRVLAALVDMTGEGQVVSRPAAYGRIVPTPDAARLVEAFVDARLLVADTADSHAAGAETIVRVAHESLLSGWPRARALIAADREVLRVRARIEAACLRWIQEGRHPDFLLAPGRPLAEAVDLAEHRPDSLEPDSIAFLDASRATETARLAEIQARAERELRLEAAASQARADAATMLVRRTRVAAAVVGVLLVVVAGAAVIANSARQEAQRKTAQAERNFNAALSGGAGLLDAVNTHLRDGGMTRDVAVALLGQAESSLGRLAGENGGGPGLADTRARLLAAFSTVQVALCDSTGAMARAQEAVEIAETTVRIAPSDQAKQTLANALAARGAAEAEADTDSAKAFASYRAAEAIQVVVPGDAAREDLHATRNQIAALLLATDDVGGATAILRDNLAFYEQRAAERPDDLGRRGALALGVLRAGDAALQRKDFDAATAAYARHAEIVRGLQTSQPDSMEWQRALSINLVQSARVLALRGDVAGALKEYRQGAAAVGQVAAQDAGNGQWQRSVIWARVNLSVALLRGGAREAAVAVLEPAIKAAAALNGEGVTSGVCLHDAALLHDIVANELFVLGRKADAAAAAAVGLEAFRRYAVAAPHDPRRQWEMVARRHQFATFLALAGKPAEAAEQLRAGLAQAYRLSDQPSPEWLDETSAMRLELGDTLAEQGDRPAALAVFAAIPAPSDFDDGRQAHERAMGQYRIGKLTFQTDAAAAGDALASALTGLRAALLKQPQNPTWRSDFVSVAQQRAGWLMTHGDKADAMALYLAALRESDALLADRPTDLILRHQHAGALMMTYLGYKLAGQQEESGAYFKRYQEETNSLSGKDESH